MKPRNINTKPCPLRCYKTSATCHAEKAGQTPSAEPVLRPKKEHINIAGEGTCKYWVPEQACSAVPAVSCLWVHICLQIRCQRAAIPLHIRLFPLHSKHLANPRALLHHAFCLNFTSHHVSHCSLFSELNFSSSTFCRLPCPSTPLSSSITAGEQHCLLLRSSCRGVFLRTPCSAAVLLVSKLPSPSCCAAAQKLPQG